MSKEINELIIGYKRFREHYFSNSNKTFDNLIKLGQNPKVMIISCCDSRVDPSIIFGCEPGDLFVIRNVANLVPPFENNSSYHGTSAAIEFGISNLDIHDVIILGHSFCGGIRALLENVDLLSSENFISKWMELAKPAREKTLENYPNSNLDQQADMCGQYALVNSHNNLMTFPLIQEKVKSGFLSLHAWFFDLSTGLIYMLNQEQNKFEPIEG